MVRATAHQNCRAFALTGYSLCWFHETVKRSKTNAMRPNIVAEGFRENGEPFAFIHREPHRDCFEPGFVPVLQRWMATPSPPRRFFAFCYVCHALDNCATDLQSIGHEQQVRYL